MARWFLFRAAVYAAVVLAAAAVALVSFAIGSQQTEQRVNIPELCEVLHEHRPGVVLMNGIDTIRALSVMCDAIAELQKRPSWSTCFSFNLVFNQPVTDEAAVMIRRELEDVLPKIGEACKAVFPNREKTP